MKTTTNNWGLASTDTHYLSFKSPVHTSKAGHGLSQVPIQGWQTNVKVLHHNGGDNQNENSIELEE